jgi:inorganic triphosphatase YgiF
MSKREQEKAIEDTKKVAEQAKSVEDKLEAAETLQEVGQQAAAQEIQQTYRRSLDETKENVRKSIEEARSQIPKYTNVVKSYQEQALESTGKMVEDYINTQKSVMGSVFSSSAPYYENTYRMYSYWFSLVRNYGPEQSATLSKISQQLQE